MKKNKKFKGKKYFKVENTEGFKHKKINNSLKILCAKEKTFPAVEKVDNKSPIMMYPSLNKNLKKFNQTNVSTNTNPEGKIPLKTEDSGSNLMGIQSISDLNMHSRDLIQRSIQDFISHKRNSKTDSCSQLNLKNFYIGKYKNPDLQSNNNAISYENLNIKEYSNSNFGNFNKFYQKNYKFSTLFEEKLPSGCCSPSSDDQSIENNSNMVRFMPKDSYEDLEQLNINMASKVKLISRKHHPRKSQNIENKDQEIRKFRRSSEKLKNMKEREIIRYHKHKRTGTNFFIETEDPNRVSHGQVTPKLVTPKNKFVGMMPVYQRQIFLKTEGENKTMEVEEN